MTGQGPGGQAGRDAGRGMREAFWEKEYCCKGAEVSVCVLVGGAALPSVLGNSALSGSPSVASPLGKRGLGVEGHSSLGTSVWERKGTDHDSWT